MKNVMESFGESNCHSMSDSFLLYERYMRSFNVVNNFTEESHEPSDDSGDSNSAGNLDLPDKPNVTKHCETVELEYNSLMPQSDHKEITLNRELCGKANYLCSRSLATSSLENSSVTTDNYEKSNLSDVPSSEDSRQGRFKPPVFITSTMENSNNAVDSVPLFREMRHTESVFKLPISELTFNGTLKHVQRLRPIVDPMTALSCVNKEFSSDSSHDAEAASEFIESKNEELVSEMSQDASSETNRAENVTESTGDSLYEGIKKQCTEGNSKWNETSYSSLEASFDSGVRSPDMFSDDDVGPAPKMENIWTYLKGFEAFEKKKVRKIEETLQGVLPPPSVTQLKISTAEMLKKYYINLPFFDDNAKPSEPITMTPTKRVSFVEIPELRPNTEPKNLLNAEKKQELLTKDVKEDSLHDKSIEIKLCSETEAREMVFPDLLKCRYYDVYYNSTTYSEKFELLSQRYGERFVGAETDTSVNIYSGGMQSPSSASKRKAMRLKMAQAKSPGRRLSHLARRRQAFCSAGTINEKAQASNSKMVLIDKNFFPHRKLINSSERKSPRFRRTPGKKTPNRRTPGKKTPAKTPKTRSGGSSRKKAMRRLLMDSESMTRSQPTRETLKRALFISPENKNTLQPAPCSSVPLNAMKSKRALFSSPERADTKSMDGTRSDQFLKRKLDSVDGVVENSRSKIAKSLSFGGDTIGNTSQHAFVRRSSEVFSSRNTAELNETHKKKLLWAVSEALRVHGWRMSSPGFREKASALARLTRKLLTLPPHAARFAAPKLSTSETMLKLARQYVFAIIQGRTVEDCFEEEQTKVANETCSKVTGYISASAYQQIKSRQATSIGHSFQQIKENCNNSSTKSEQPKSNSKNILQDKLVNIDANSNSSSGFGNLEKVGIFKSNSMPSFEEAAKMRARRQISFDNVDFPKR